MWAWALKYCGYLNHWFHSCIFIFTRYKYFRFSSQFPVDRSIMGCRYTHHWTERPRKCRNRPRRQNFVDPSLLTQVIACIQNTDIFRTRILTPAAILDSRIGIGNKLSPFCRGTISTTSSKSIPVCPDGFWSSSEKIEGLGWCPSSARHSESPSKARVNCILVV